MSRVANIDAQPITWAAIVQMMASFAVVLRHRPDALSQLRTELQGVNTGPKEGLYAEDLESPSHLQGVFQELLVLTGLKSQYSPFKLGM